MNGTGPHPAGKGPIESPPQKPTHRDYDIRPVFDIAPEDDPGMGGVPGGQVEAITQTLQDLEEDNRRLRAENERLKLAGNELAAALEHVAPNHEEADRLRHKFGLPVDVPLGTTLARWREALR